MAERPLTYAEILPAAYLSLSRTNWQRRSMPIRPVLLMKSKPVELFYNDIVLSLNRMRFRYYAFIEYLKQ